MPEDTDSLLVTVDHPVDGVAVITLNRPERLNALSFALVDQLHDALDQVHRDNDCRAVVLTGAGKGFCSGLDLTSIDTETIGPSLYRVKAYFRDPAHRDREITLGLNFEVETGVAHRVVRIGPMRVSRFVIMWD